MAVACVCARRPPQARCSLRAATIAVGSVVEELRQQSRARAAQAAPGTGCCRTRLPATACALRRTARSLLPASVSNVRSARAAIEWRWAAACRRRANAHGHANALLVENVRSARSYDVPARRRAGAGNRMIALQARADCRREASLRRADARRRRRDSSPSPVPGELRLASSRTKRSTTRARSSAGMPGPVSATRSSTPIGRLRRATVTLAAGGRVFDGVVDEIGERLRDQAAIAVDHRGAGRRDRRAMTPFSSASGA